MKKEEAIVLLYSKGSRVQAKGWDKDSYIVLDKGAIVDQDGKAFDMTTAKATEWVEWVKPVEVKAEHVITKEEAIVLLYSKGSRVQAKGWDKDSYIVLDKGAIVDQDGKAFDMTTAKATEWIEWIKPVEVSNNVPVEVIEKMNNLEKMLAEAIKGNKKPTLSNKDDAHEKIMAVYGVDNPTDVKKLFKEALESAENEYEIQKAIVMAIPYCWIGRELSFTAALYASMRNIVKEVGGEFEELALGLLLPPARSVKRFIDGVETVVDVGLYEALNMKNGQKVLEKLGDEQRDVYSIETMYSIKNKLNDFILNNNFPQSSSVSSERAKFYVYISYLALVTGRRFTEILFTLKLIEENDVWFYTGINKSKGDKKIKAYSLDDDFERLKEMLKFVQNHVASEMEGKKMTKTTVASKFNGVSNGALKRLTGLEYTFHGIREISVDMMWVRACENKEVVDCNMVEEEKFKGMVYGHVPPKGALRASLHYMTKKGVHDDN